MAPPDPAGPIDARPQSSWGLAAFGAPAFDQIYLRPTGLVTGAAAAVALAAGQGIATGRRGEAALLVELLTRHPMSGIRSVLVPAEEFLAADERFTSLITHLTAPRSPWAGLSLDRPLVMGVLNVTPDSFSDGGELMGPDAALARARAMLESGADLIDVGGESTRPGAAPVDPADEAARIVPVIRALSREGAVVSVDTRHVPVMAAALDAGARILNDVTALAAPGALDLASDSGAAVVLMHMQGEPRTMQAAPHYDVPALDVFDMLAARVTACIAAGLSRSAIMVDPGIGFGKTAFHNLAILGALGLYRTLGCGVALGVSRKGFIGHITGVAVPRDRVAGSLAAGLAGVAAGADLLRVHDVAETVQALSMRRAITAERG